MSIAYHWESVPFKSIDCGPVKTVQLALANGEIIAEELQVDLDCEVDVTSWITCFGTEYRPEMTEMTSMWFLCMCSYKKLVTELVAMHTFCFSLTLYWLFSQINCLYFILHYWFKLQLVSLSKCVKLLIDM